MATAVQEHESDDGITDEDRTNTYGGSDVQDYLTPADPRDSLANENKSNKEWYDSKLFENLKRKWAK